MPHATPRFPAANATLFRALIAVLVLPLGLAAQNVPGTIAFPEAGGRLLKAIYPAGFGPEDGPVTVSVVDERQGAEGRPASTEGFVTGILIQQVSFAAAAQVSAWQVIEGDFIVNALAEKEKAAEKDIPWEKARDYGNFDLVKYVLSCDARKAGDSWILTLRVVDLQKGSNKGAAQCTVAAKDLDALIRSQAVESLPPLRAALSQNLEAALKKAAVQLKKAGGERLALAVGNLNFAERDVGGPAAQFLANELESILGEQGRVVRLPGGEKPSSQALGTLKARFPDLRCDGVLEGRYYDQGDSVRLYLTLLSYPDGEVLAQASAQFRSRELPAGLALEPPANPVPAWTIANLSSGTGLDRDFRLELSSNHGNGGTYYDGEKMQLWVRATKDCFIKIYHFDVTGKRQLIFPNQFQKDNAVKGGVLLPFPGPNAPFAFQLGAPFGTERVKVVASTTPFLNEEADFTTGQSLGTGAQGMSRGLVVAPRSATAEAQLSYAILAARP